MFTVNWLTENFWLTGLPINRTETGNMAAAPSVAKIYLCALKTKKYKQSKVKVISQ